MFQHQLRRDDPGAYTVAVDTRDFLGERPDD